MIEDELPLQSRDVRKRRTPPDPSGSTRLLRLVLRAVLTEEKEDYVVIANLAKELRARAPEVRACLGRLVRTGVLAGPVLVEDDRATYLGREVTRRDGVWVYSSDWYRKSTGMEVGSVEAAHGRARLGRREAHYRKVASKAVQAKQSRKVALRPSAWDGKAYFMSFSAPAFLRALKEAGLPSVKQEWTCGCGRKQPFTEKSCYKCSQSSPLVRKEKPSDPVVPRPPILCKECGRPLEFKMRQGKKVYGHPRARCRNNRVQDVLDG